MKKKDNKKNRKLKISEALDKIASNNIRGAKNNSFKTNKNTYFYHDYIYKNGENSSNSNLRNIYVGGNLIAKLDINTQQIIFINE